MNDRPYARVLIETYSPGETRENADNTLYCQGDETPLDWLGSAIAMSARSAIGVNALEALAKAVMAYDDICGAGREWPDGDDDDRARITKAQRDFARAASGLVASVQDYRQKANK